MSLQIVSFQWFSVRSSGFIPGLYLFQQITTNLEKLPLIYFFSTFCCLIMQLFCMQAETILLYRCIQGHRQMRYFITATKQFKPRQSSVHIVLTIRHTVPRMMSSGSAFFNSFKSLLHTEM